MSNSNYGPSFTCSYAVLAEAVHTPELGVLEKTLVVGKAGEKKVLSLTKYDDVFEVQVLFKGKTHIFVMPVEHVRLMVPIVPKIQLTKVNGTTTKA